MKEFESLDGFKEEHMPIVAEVMWMCSLAILADLEIYYPDRAKQFYREMTDRCKKHKQDAKVTAEALEIIKIAAKKVAMIAIQEGKG